MTPVSTSVMTRADAFKIAKAGSAKRTIYVFDHMARRGKPCRWDWRGGRLVNSEVRE